MKKFALTFTRWFIFYPITIPACIIIYIPLLLFFLLWESIVDLIGSSTHHAGRRMLTKYGKLISKPLSFLSKFDKNFNV